VVSQELVSQGTVQSTIEVSEDWKRSGREAEIPEGLTREIAKGGGITFVGQVIGKCVNFLFQILLARVLGASTYGIYALGYNLLVITQTVSLLGLGNGVVRFGSMYRGKGNRNRLKGTCLVAFVLSLASAIIVSTLLFLFAPIIAVDLFDEPDLTAPLRVFSFSLPFYSLMTIAAYSARAFRRMEYDVGVQRVFHPLVNLIIVSAAFLFGFRLMGVVYGFLISSAVAAGLGIYLLWLIFPDLISGLKPDYELKRLLYYSLTILLIGFSHLLLSSTDRIVLGIFHVAQDVGIYNAALVAASQTAIFLGSFNTIFSPIIADLYHQERMKQLESLFKITTKWIFAMTLPIFLILVIFSGQIMALFGSQFRNGWMVLIILAIAQLLNASTGAVGFMLTMTGHQKIELVNSLIFGGLNILLNILLVQTYGILGVAIAIGLSLSLINLARLLEVYYLFHLHPYKASYWKPLMAGAVAAIFGLGIDWFAQPDGWFWLAGAGIFGVVYVLVLISLGLEEEEKVVLKAVKDKFRLSFA
jgi:O-antigen/teichoic acid export membrane protein